MDTFAGYETDHSSSHPSTTTITVLVYDMLPTTQPQKPTYSCGQRPTTYGQQYTQRSTTGAAHTGDVASSASQSSHVAAPGARHMEPEVERLKQEVR